VGVGVCVCVCGGGAQLSNMYCALAILSL
jgi:hypothetical protein